MTLASIMIPEWITWEAHPDKVRQTQLLVDYALEPDVADLWPITAVIRGPAKTMRYSYGLHSRCDSLLESCRPFPRFEDCQGSNQQFCALWRTTGFLMSFAVVLELAGIVGFVIILLGGKQKRETGWRVMVSILLICAAAQAASMGIVVDRHHHDEQFFDGWYLGKSFVLATISWAMQALLVAGLLASVFALSDEGGYELIPDRERTD